MQHNLIVHLHHHAKNEHFISSTICHNLPLQILVWRPGGTK